MKTIRWGIIGCGDVCELKSGPAFQRVEGSSLVAVMRRDAAKAEDFAQRHGVPRWYWEAEALVHDPEVDAIYIATPPGSHREYALMAARAGKPVYVEKPMARSHAECEEMITVCRDAGVPLFVAYYRRSLPRFERVRELVQSGGIGEPQSVHVAFRRPPSPKEQSADKPWRVLPEQSGGGHLWDMGSHALDYLDHVLGPIRHVQGLAKNFGGLYGPEDTICGIFAFASGCLGTGAWSFSSGVSEDRLEFIGSEGNVSLSVFGTEPPVVLKGGKETKLPAETPAHIQQPLIERIVRALEGGETCPSTGESAARTNSVLEQLVATYQER